MFQPNIGVDIGSTYVRAVQVGEKKKDRLNIMEAAEVALPHGAVVAGEIINMDLVTEAVKFMWDQYGFKGKTVTFGLAGNQTMVRQVDLPWEPPAIFRDALPLRVAKDLPVEPSEMVLDAYFLGERTIRNSLVERTLVVGALNASTENTERVLSTAKLKTKRADFSPFALIRAATYCSKSDEPIPGMPEPGIERPCQVIVDLGAHVTNVILHDNGRPLFVRSVANGSEAVTRALADQIGTSFDAAEYLKKKIGLGQTIPNPLDAEYEEELPAQAEAIAQQIAAVMTGIFVQTVRESVEYFLTATPSTSHVDSVTLTGGGTLLPGYAARVQTELRAPTSFLAPIKIFGGTDLANFSGTLDPKFGVAYGLAVKVGK